MVYTCDNCRFLFSRTAAAYLGSPSDAVDAVDEAFYKGFFAYQKLRQPEFFDTWLTRILINVCNSELRRRKRELAVAAAFSPQPVRPLLFTTMCSISASPKP